jgi:hypothetical protein
VATNESSGRWDATGSFQLAVAEQRNLAKDWATGLTISQLRQAVATMASDNNAFTLYERKALLDEVLYYI